jgi:hypothetical protein
MDTLVEKGVLSDEETQAALQMAMDSVGPRGTTEEGSGVSRVFAGLVRRFAQRRD